MCDAVCMKIFSSPAQKIGEMGERVACRFLEKRGFKIVERNYTKKWGELDIVAQFHGLTHFIEVKSVSCENVGSVIEDNLDLYGPEDHLHELKLKRLSRTIETYVSEMGVGEWRFDIPCVYLDHGKRLARVKMISDVIL